MVRREGKVISGYQPSTQQPWLPSLGGAVEHSVVCVKQLGSRNRLESYIQQVPGLDLQVLQRNSTKTLLLQLIDVIK